MGSVHFTVDSAAAGQRLDLFIAGRCAEPEAAIPMSRAGVRKLIDAGHVTVNRGTVKAGLRLKAQDHVEICLPEIRDTGLIGEALPLSVLYEDEDVLVVNKAAGMVVHPAAGCASGTLVNAILHYCPAIAGIGGERRPGIVHRLDKDTSGVMVVAKNDLAMRGLMEQFKSRTVHKEYLALVHGSMTGERGEIDRAIGRHRTDRKRMSSLRVTGKSRQAITQWTVEERYAVPLAARGIAWYCLIRLEPWTGRTHQIRVHLADADHPLVGDRVYGRRHPSAGLDDRVSGRMAGFPRQALHAETLDLDHVRTGTRMRFRAPLPDDMIGLIDDLRKHAVNCESLRPKGLPDLGLTRLGV
ncbi:MAG TPA: RluA family pseudouridine synthase [Candidatus Binatia bacterium]|nr:RluA family pseudouridine synthase [Candidatus Binatia bacterium]